MIDSEFFLVDPLRHPRFLALLGDLAVNVLCEILQDVCGMRHHLLLRSPRFLAEFFRRAPCLCTSPVGERAIAWESEVQPLREEAAVQTDLTTVLCGDLLKQRLELAPNAWRVLLIEGRLHGKVPYGRYDRCGRCRRLAEGRLDLGEDCVAPVRTTHEIVGRRNGTIRRRLHVVRDDNLRPQQPRRLVERAELPEVGHRL
mmetsp:Transcript_28037/g.77459  ORF Transcript_28037/g.77459 Transcript_28037/m.77459 type:complete len:200 (+) Transcript_28037:312-911(+)